MKKIEYNLKYIKKNLKAEATDLKVLSLKNITEKELKSKTF